MEDLQETGKEVPNLPSHEEPAHLGNEHQNSNFEERGGNERHGNDRTQLEGKENPQSESAGSQKSGSGTKSEQASKSKLGDRQQSNRAKSPSTSSETENEVLEKVPYTSTPLGRPITQNASEEIVTTPTPNNPIGGTPGYTRNGGKQIHEGLDLPLDVPIGTPNRDIISRYTGTVPGVVISARPAYIYRNGLRMSLGYQVTIKTKTQNHIYTSRTMHHAGVFVKPGDIVKNGDPIAFGGGVGDQFGKPGAGAPHVHWEVRRDGQLIDPRDGRELGPRPSSSRRLSDGIQKGATLLMQRP